MFPFLFSSDVDSEENLFRLDNEQEIEKKTKGNANTMITFFAGLPHDLSDRFSFYLFVDDVNCLTTCLATLNFYRVLSF